jgi:LysR family glycine cleavage system transcriptional activator
MSRRLPPLNALKAFEAAARHLSFTRAAEELFVTQAAISHQIKALEEYLGIKLFRRKNRSLLLTEEGQSYFLDIKDIFASISEATDKLLARSAKGALTVSLQPSFAIQWLVPRLVKFSERHPDIDVRIKAVDMDEGSLTDDVDVAIYYGRGNWPGLRSDKLHTEYLIPVCSPLLLTGPKPLRTPDDLTRHTLLHDTSRRDHGDPGGDPRSGGGARPQRAGPAGDRGGSSHLPVRAGAGEQERFLSGVSGAAVRSGQDSGLP